MKTLQYLMRFLKNRSGATVVEYCLIAGVISVAVVGGASAIGSSTNNSFNSVQAGFEQST